METQVLQTIEEQIVLGFTGKINLTSKDAGQILGCAYMISGELVNVKYKGIQGRKAFYNACIESKVLEINTVIEPEIVSDRERKIDRPFSVLKRKMIEIAQKYEEAKKNRPPDNLKLLIIPDFLNREIEVNSAEFNLLCTLSDYNKVSDVYKHNPLLDYEITNALVGLRQKGAIKVVQEK